MANYQSGQPPKSKISKGLFAKRLSSVYGYNAVKRSDAKTDFERNTNLRFVKVDLNNPAYRIRQASVGTIFSSYQLSTTLQKYFDAYMNETMQSYSDIGERQDRLNELHFMVANDPFISRCVELYGFEATQIDDQSRLITVESPSAPFINKCYELFSAWGVTQQRVQKVCKNIEEYGEAIWAHRVTERGIEKIIPLRVNSLIERLEFNGERMAEYLAQINGSQALEKNRGTKIERLMAMLLGEKNEDGTDKMFDVDENFADVFDSKLLGFEFHDDIIVPPWCVTHFRYDADSSDFFPYGTPPLLNCIAPFKQANSTMILQGLARAMSFPVTIYKVKTTEGMPPASAFSQCDLIREEYENIGVTPASNSLEVYTLNTKIWVPEGLLDIDVKESKVDMDFVGDLELYQDRVAIAAGVPKSYLDQEFGGFGNSGIALVEQYKPFARQVYTIQQCFLDGLADLIRLHFAITGEFDYNIPFVLTMRFPAEDMGQEKRDARQASVDLANSVVELVSAALGLEEGEPLPEDIIFDIMARYTFIDEADVMKWMRYRQQFDAERAAAEAEGDDEDEEGGEGGDDMFGDLDMGDEGGGDEGGDAGGEDMSESDRRYYLETKRALRERKVKEAAARKKLALKEKKQRKLKEIAIKEARTKRLVEQYKSTRHDIYFKVLKETGLTQWNDRRGHALLANEITPNHPMYESVRVLTEARAEVNSGRKLREAALRVDDLRALGQGTENLSVDVLTEAVANLPSKDDDVARLEMDREDLV
jgi:hypothetical protein